MRWQRESSFWQGSWPCLGNAHCRGLSVGEEPSICNKLLLNKAGLAAHSSIPHCPAWQASMDSQPKSAEKAKRAAVSCAKTACTTDHRGRWPAGSSTRYNNQELIVRHPARDGCGKAMDKPSHTHAIDSQQGAVQNVTHRRLCVLRCPKRTATAPTDAPGDLGRGADQVASPRLTCL